MRFELDVMRATPGRLFRLRGAVPVAEVDWRGEPVKLEGPVAVEARASYQNDQVFLNIRVRARAHRACSRCLRDVVEPVEFGGDMDVFPEDAEGKYLELGPFVEAAVRLGMSTKPLCRRDCRGICPECGADLNLEQHKSGCTHGTKGDPRLKKLKVLLEHRSGQA